MELCRVRTDVLVIGGGLAGLSAALELRTEGWDVLIVSKGKVGRSGNTVMTRNSMAAVIEEGPATGTVREHVEDTLAGGSYINDSNLVETLAEKAGQAIERLVGWGVPFIRENGKIAVKGSPGHRARRLITVDASMLRSTYTAGLALSLPLAKKLEASSTKFVDGLLITGLVSRKGQVCGAVGLSKRGAEAWLIEAKVVILAGGGAGQLYPLTTNAGDVTGDGYVLGHRAGAEVIGLEFIQFHPTVTIGQGKEVMSTAPFGDGAVLRNHLGEAFMGRYSAQGDMATRDVMARAIDAEIKAGRGTERGGVFVDFSKVPEAKMLREYAPIYSRIRGAKSIEVGTAAHFMMGGLVIDRGGHTGIPGLYACGEVAGGVHGANRLAGNALTEAVVFGIEAARQVLHDGIWPVGSLGISEFEEVFRESGVHPGLNLPITTEAGDSPLEELEAMKKNLRTVMGAQVGLVRSENGLGKAAKAIERLRSELEGYAPADYKALLTWQELKLMAEAASLIAKAARERKDSLGAHYRLEV